ncbi:DUF1654 domain-containing protein [Pseudomonas sp. MDT2-39-1]
MAKAKKQAKQTIREEVSGVQRLGMRVSSMINHPVAQTQRWVTIHRLDTDGDREWDEVMGLLHETDGIDMTFNDDECGFHDTWTLSPRSFGHSFHAHLDT